MSSTNEIDAMMLAAMEGGDDPRITTYALGEMEPAERAAFEAELLARPELKQEVDRVRALARTIEGELQADAAPVAGLAAEAKAKVLAPATPTAAPAGKVQKAPVRWRPWVEVAAAASILGMLGLGATMKFKDALGNAYGAATNKIESDITAKINGGGDGWGGPFTRITIEGSDGTTTTEAAPVTRTATRGPHAATEAPPATEKRPPPTTTAAKPLAALALRREVAEGQDARLGTHSRDVDEELEARRAKESLSYALTEGEALDAETRAQLKRVVEEARQLEARGDLDKAVELFDKALAIAGGDPRVGTWDAAVDRLQGRLDRGSLEFGRPSEESVRKETAGVLEDLERAVALAPKDEALRGLLDEAKQQQQKGDAGAARARARAALGRLQELQAAAAVRSSIDNPFKKAAEEDTGTFSIDVDTAGFATVRNSIERSQLPQPEAVRIEELLNYFPYAYAPPTDGRPFAANVEVTACPWQPKNRLVRIGIKGKELAKEARPVSNLVFLIDVSGSMQEPQKLPLLKQSLTALVDNLSEKDRVAIVVYAGASGLVLPSTTGDRKQEIIAALDQLQAGGGTNGGAGIELAYKVAVEHFITGGTNRVVLCTDGDWNVGISDLNGVERLVVEKAKSGVFLTCLGFFGSNYQDQMMERMADKGNGNYAGIDSLREAKKVLVEEMSGTLVTIAKDVKIQVEFNKEKVESYRLIGYENRVMANRDFSDDTKDAGEIGAGHCVTALYEVEPKAAAAGGDLLTLRLRWKKPDGQTSELLETRIPDSDRPLGQASVDTRFAASVAAWGMLLRSSPYRGSASFGLVEELGGDALGKDPGGHRAAWLELVKKSKALAAPAPRGNGGTTSGGYRLSGDRTQVDDGSGNWVRYDPATHGDLPN